MLHKAQYLSKENLEAVWDRPVREIAEKFGVSQQAVYAWAKKWGLPSRGKATGPRVDDPSEEEIAERARLVRQAWSPEEERRRLVGEAKKASRWTPPMVRVGEIEPPSYARI